MRPVLLSPLFVGACLAPLAAWAAEFTVQPSAIFDAVMYGDDANGEGTHMIQEALGIYNVHGHHEGEEEGGGHEGEEEGGGHSHGGTLKRGFNFRSAELALSAQLPGWFDGRFQFVTDGKEGEVEEAWLRTQFLPGGLQLKGGKMLSDIGYLNNQHPHDWDFVDQSLPYQMLLGGNLSGGGVQLSWLAPTPFYLRLGAEALSGDNPGIAAHVGPTNSEDGDPINFERKGNWPNVWTVFAKIGGEVARNHEVQGGLSWIHSKHHQELHHAHPGINNADHGLQGNADMWGVDMVYKFDAPGADGAGDIKVQAEYWRQNKDLNLTFHELKPQLVGQPRDLTVDGAYIQALYGIAPRWQVGARYDIAGMTHEASRAGSTVGPTTTSTFDDMDRISAVATWNISHNQRLRLQISHASVPVSEDINDDGKDDPVRKSFNQVFLQYQIGLGAHGAHSF